MKEKDRYTIKETIEYVQKKGLPDFNQYKLEELVAIGELRPCFYWNGVLEHMLIDSTKDSYAGYSLNKSIKLEFTGYISPTDLQKSIKLSSLNSNQGIHVKEFNILNDIEQKLIYPPHHIFTTIIKDFGYDDNFDSDEYEYSSNRQIEQASKSISGTTKFFVLGGVTDINYDVKLGIELSSDRCLFFKSALDSYLVRQAQFESALLSDNSSINNENSTIIARFAPAVLSVIKSLGLEPKALPKHIKFGKRGIRQQVFDLLSKSPDTKDLVRSYETFKTYWQQLRKKRILIEK